MYHSIEDLIKKVNVIKKKTDRLQTLQQGSMAKDPAVLQYEIEDIQALCADIANDKSKAIE